jgi:Flp pilus assembly protein TadB
MNDSGPAQ